MQLTYFVDVLNASLAIVPLFVYSVRILQVFPINVQVLLEFRDLT